MKRKIIISVLAVFLGAIILFFPFSHAMYDDGGTVEYGALTYKIVKWKKYEVIYDENKDTEYLKTYSNTSVYWFPDNFKSIDELWEIEDKERDARAEQSHNG